MPTDRLYYHDATLLEFDAVAIALHENNPRQVILDRTAFYPTSGGQPFDTGTINNAVVEDVTDAGDQVVHHLAQPISLGPVHGRVDAERRHDHMQQHTAQHLLSALAADRLKWPTTSVHFGAETSNIEFRTASASESQLAELERWANAAVNASLPVDITFEDTESAVARGLRKAPERTGELRVITIDGLDRSACGGTHVSQTAQIGAIRILGSERVRGQVRISFLAGERTLRRLRSSDALIDAMAQAMSCAPFELVELLPKRMNELREVRERLEKLEQQAAAERLRQLVAIAIPDAHGVRKVIHCGDEPPAVLRSMAQGAGTMEQVVFVGVSDSASGIVIGTSPDSEVDAGALLKSVLAQVGGKGGGSARLAQGSLPAAGLYSEIARIFDQIYSRGGS